MIINAAFQSYRPERLFFSVNRNSSTLLFYVHYIFMRVIQTNILWQDKKTTVRLSAASQPDNQIVVFDVSARKKKTNGNQTKHDPRTILFEGRVLQKHSLVWKCFSLMSL